MNPKNKKTSLQNSHYQNKPLANALVQKLIIGKNIGIIDYANSTNPLFFNGQVIDETRGTFLIRLENRKIKRIPKNRAEFILKDESTGQYYRIQGKLYIGRPEERIKNEIRKLW